MAASMLAGSVALVCAFIGGSALSLRIFSTPPRTSFTHSGFRGHMAWRLRHGFESTLPFARLLLRIPVFKARAQEGARLCSQKGYTAFPETLTSIFLLIVGIAGGVAGVANTSVIGGIAVAACVVVAAFIALGRLREREWSAVRNAVPDALESMSACFSTGLTLLQTFKQVSCDVSEPLASTFRQAAHVLETGDSASSALSVLQEGAYAKELAFVAVALDVQHQSGGAMKQVLEAASDMVESELSLKRKLRAQTAQAKLSAQIVAVMPLVLIAAFSIASPDFLTPFFTSVFGYALLALALVMQLAGIALVRHALAVGGSL